MRAFSLKLSCPNQNNSIPSNNCKTKRTATSSHLIAHSVHRLHMERATFPCSNSMQGYVLPLSEDGSRRILPLHSSNFFLLSTSQNLLTVSETSVEQSVSPRKRVLRVTRRDIPSPSLLTNNVDWLLRQWFCDFSRHIFKAFKYFGMNSITWPSRIFRNRMTI